MADEDARIDTVNIILDVYGGIGRESIKLRPFMPTDADHQLMIEIYRKWHEQMKEDVATLAQSPAKDIFFM